MKEQVQMPYGDKGDASDQDKGSKPKSISRPMVAQGLEKPKVSTLDYGKIFQRCGTCDEPGCNAPVYEQGPDQWKYFDAGGHPIEAGDLPLRGKRMFPGSPYQGGNALFPTPS